MQLGFTILSRGREMECRLFGAADRAERPLVTVARAPEHFAVLMGRLYYRNELAGGGVSPMPEGPLSDAALALAVYRRQGPEGLAQLEGDFALGIWDARENRLLGMRDPLGGYPLFWSVGEEGFALSTRLRPLLERLPCRRLDPEYLADFLMLPGCSFAEVDGERCVFQGVQRVRAGTMVLLDTVKNSAQRWRYWNWLERLKDPGTDRLEEVGEQLAGLLRQAVRERICGRTASHLSGGMDSTSVALIARDGIDAGVGEPPLHALALVHERLTSLTRERSYLEAALGQKGVRAHRIPADNLLAFDSFAAPPVHEEPCPPLHCLGSDGALVEAAAGAGAATVLTGYGADEMLDVPPYHLTELLKRGRLWSAWTEASRWAGAEGVGLWQILYPYGLANLLPAWARDGIGPIWRGGYARWEKQGDFTIPPWVRPDFARRYGLRGRALANARRTYASCRPAGLSVALAAISHRIGDPCRWYLAAPRGLATAHPFLDPRVLQFGLGCRARLRSVPGPQKPILAAAMRDVLPAAIRHRRGKGNFNEPYFLGLARHLPKLEALVRHAPLADLDLLDRDRLLLCLHQAALGVAGDARGLDRLNLTLVLLRWLSEQEQWQHLAEPVTGIIRLGRQEAGQRSPAGRREMKAGDGIVCSEGGMQ